MIGQWFDRQKAYLDSLETQLRGLVKAIDIVAKQRAGQYMHFNATKADLILEVQTFPPPRASSRKRSRSLQAVMLATNLYRH